MHFCFDNLEGGENTTVALTCPQRNLTKSLAKCCPTDKMIKDGQCIPIGDANKKWSIPINGHLYDSSRLIQEDRLKYEPNQTSKVSL